MQCQCGAETRTKGSTKTVKKKLVAYLEWEECPKCGRTSDVVERRRSRKTEKFVLTGRGPTGPHWSQRGW